MPENKQTQKQCNGEGSSLSGHSGYFKVIYLILNVCVFIFFRESLFFPLKSKFLFHWSNIIQSWPCGSNDESRWMDLSTLNRRMCKTKKTLKYRNPTHQKDTWPHSSTLLNLLSHEGQKEREIDKYSICLQ